MNIYIKNKKLGETSLECLERVRVEENITKETAMTFAGRLDPAAEGEMVFLTNEDIKQKDKYLKSDKIYQVDLLFGVQTDTADLLGLIKNINTNITINENDLKDKLKKLIGQRQQNFHAFSSKVVDGKPLWQHAKAGNNIQVSHEINIYKIDLQDISKINSCDIYTKVSLLTQIIKGDFRQDEILNSWNDFKSNNNVFYIATILVQASSGSYMRVLAEELGLLMNIPICVYSINRKKVFFK